MRDMGLSSRPLKQLEEIKRDGDISRPACLIFAENTYEFVITPAKSLVPNEYAAVIREIKNTEFLFGRKRGDVCIAEQPLRPKGRDALYKLAVYPYWYKVSELVKTMVESSVRTQ